MFANSTAVATVAVSDLDRARAFYGQTLGLPLAEERPGVLSYRTGTATLLVYQSEFAGTNKATSVTFFVDDAVATAAELKAKGVAFEHYDDMPMPRQGDVYVGDGMAVAWFKDPEGAILSMVSEG